jgi:hypothetical protein
MNRSTVRAVFTSVILGVCASDAVAQNTVAEELVQIESDWCRADIEADTAFFRRVLADEYTGVGSRGGKDTKYSYIASLPGSLGSLTACKDDDLQVRVYGDVAVVTGVATVSGVRGGIAYANRRVLFTNVYVRRDGRWQSVASQGTLADDQQR